NYCDVRLISDAVHSFGMKFFLYFQIEARSDSGGLGLLSGSNQPTVFGTNENTTGIIDIEGNILNMLTNYHADGFVFVPNRSLAVADQWAMTLRVIRVCQTHGSIYLMSYGMADPQRQMAYVNSWKPAAPFAFADGATSYADLMTMLDIAETNLWGVG